MLARRAALLIPLHIEIPLCGRTSILVRCRDLSPLFPTLTKTAGCISKIPILELTPLQPETCPILLPFLTSLESALPGCLPFYTRISHPKSFRSNTSKSVDPKQLKVPLKSIVLKNRGGGGPLLLTRTVNQSTNTGPLSRAIATVRGSDAAGPSAVDWPVRNRTDVAALPHIYSRCAILPSLRPGDRPFLPPWRLS